MQFKDISKTLLDKALSSLDEDVRNQVNKAINEVIEDHNSVKTVAANIFRKRNKFAVVVCMYKRKTYRVSCSTLEQAKVLRDAALKQRAEDKKEVKLKTLWENEDLS
jgi:ABC-type Mn2+/Zn2+ transport system ATPase subunit